MVSSTRNGELAHWCRRINIASVVAGTTSLSLTITGMVTTYNGVRTLQLRCGADDDEAALGPNAAAAAGGSGQVMGLK